MRWEWEEARVSGLIVGNGSTLRHDGNICVAPSAPSKPYHIFDFLSAILYSPVPYYLKLATASGACQTAELATRP
jgi:hypothetical protein